ncbi:MAG: hypothetical protein AAF404_05170 [Pseudomonadota bacterium]
MLPFWKLTYQAPVEDIDRIFDSITDITPLVQGKTDKNGYRAASGFEYYRPLEGTPTGAEDALRRRPDVDEMSILIPRDQSLLEKIIDAIYEVHSYYEPVIVVAEVLRSESVGLDDSDNPHRWWNQGGDWKDNA